MKIHTFQDCLLCASSHFNMLKAQRLITVQKMHLQDFQEKFFLLTTKNLVMCQCDRSVSFFVAYKFSLLD